MSNHLRHCPKHRKPLPCAHCALAAEPAQAPAAVGVMEPEPKRGRPPKHDVAMTPAERKAASRANQKAKLEDAERRNLIAKIVKIYRRQQADIIWDPKRPHLAQDQEAAKHHRERIYLQQLLTLSV